MQIFNRNGPILRACVCVFSFYKTRQNELMEEVTVDGVWSGEIIRVLRRL